MASQHHHNPETIRAHDNKPGDFQSGDQNSAERAAFAILQKARADISQCLRQHAIPPSLKKFMASGTVEEMKVRPIAGERCWLTTQALPDLYEHIRSLRDEFTGQPEITFYHAALIVKIRREVDLTESMAAFRSLWNREGLTLLQMLSSRWVIAALDTFVDQGQASERANAMAIVTFFNMLKMADTEYQLCGRPAYHAQQLDDNREHYPALWDGVRVFHLPDDDTFANMVRRMRKTLATMPFFALIFESLFNKTARADTMLTRMAPHHLRNLW